MRIHYKARPAPFSTESRGAGRGERCWRGIARRFRNGPQSGIMHAQRKAEPGRRTVKIGMGCWASLFLCLAGGVAPCAHALMKPVAINVAEAILEPFWEPSLSGLSKWQIDDGKAQELRVRQTWASVEFEWASKPTQGPALRMARSFDVDCQGYDHLLLAMTAPEGAVVRIEAVTDTGRCAASFAPSDQQAAEFSLDLAGASRVDTLTIEIAPSAEGPGAGWLKWIGLQNFSLVERYLAEHDFSQMQWDAQLQDDAFVPTFKPRYGIFMPEEELADLRMRNERAHTEGGASSWEQRAVGLRAMQPECGIHEFVSSGGRTNQPHGRVRYAGMARIGDGIAAAEAGLVLKDKALLRVAARCALSLAASEKWDEGFLDNFPGSAWELRSFRRGYTCTDIAKILDLAGEMFTEPGRTYLLRRLAEEGIGPSNYITWRYDYIYQCNQMTFFGKGRLNAYLVIEREWPRARRYTDLAVDDLRTLFGNLVMPDGGLLEPPTYAIGTIRSGCHMFEDFAHARGLDAVNVIPQRFARSGAYAAAIASTVRGADVIPFGDSGKSLDLESLIEFATLAPKGAWLAMLRKDLTPEKIELLPFGLRKKLDALPAKTPASPAFVALPETGLLSSLRELDGQPLKLFIRGNHGTRFHSHEHADTGSFVLELAGETFAMDPGIAEYDDPRHALMKRADWHNMLVPVIEGDVPHPVEQVAVNVTPQGKGTRKTFHAKLDVTPAWCQDFHRWVRTWDSPSPDRVAICDNYELARGNAAEFCWQTALPCDVQDHTVAIRGTRGTVVLTPDADCTIRIDALPIINDVPQKRVVFRKEGTRGRIRVSVALSVATPPKAP